MKNLLYSFLLIALLASCSEANRNETNRNENGRYLPVTVGDGVLKIVDTQTGRVYSRDRSNDSDPWDYVYQDYVEGAQEY